MNASMSPRFQASCCAFSTSVISDRGDCAKSDVDPRIAVVSQKTLNVITRIARYGVGVGVGVINGVAVGVGVGVDVATGSGVVGIGVGVGKSVVPSFDGSASNIMSDPDDPLVAEDVAVVVVVADVVVVIVGVGV